MRILHVLDHSLPMQSGYVFRTLGILGAQRGFGWQTVQVTSPRHNTGSSLIETHDGWTFHRTPPLSGRLAARPLTRELLEMWATARRLRTLIAAARPDIVHAHSPVLSGLPALWAARRAKVPLVYEVRALWEDAAVDLGRAQEGDVRYRTARQLETWLLRRADGIVTLCQSMRAEIAARPVAPERIVVVPNAVDPALLSPPLVRDAALADRLGLSGGRVLGFIGSFYHYEGLDLLLAALPQIRACLPGTVLVLVGGGPEAEKLQQIVDHQGLGEAVRLVGRVPHEEVHRYYGLIDVFVYPRRSIRLTELVTPLKPLEAMASGGIVLASDIGGHRELVRDGETGFLFPADDPCALARRVTEVMRTEARHSAIRAAARRFVEAERCWPACAAAYQTLYEALIARRHRIGKPQQPLIAPDPRSA